MAYRPLDDQTPEALEQEVLAQWREEDLFRQTLEASAGGEPFVFFEGPPTANGRPGIHHVFARSIKDLICRYQTMLGRSVTRIAGWDTHGLPVEIEVEKQLAISGKADIEQFGVAQFNARCRESVFRYKADWESLSERIGYWLDYSRPYVTYTNDYIESVWWLLRQLYDRDRLYQGHKVLPYCPRCGTTLSSHELAMGYATHKSPSIHVLFRLAGEPARYLLVWTTTPWTLPSNVAVAVHPDLQYVEHEVDGRRVILERGIAEQRTFPGATGGEPVATFPKIGEFSGRELVGLRYEPLLDVLEVDRERAFRVVAGDFVTAEEGTGLVHLAPAFGADDYQAGQREGLAFVNPVDGAGRFAATGWDAINGLTVFEANAPIAQRLQEKGRVFGRYQADGYEHTYPFCWRCDSPLIYYARESWFVRTTAYSDDMLAINRAVNWNPPEVGAGRFGEWLENNVDWALTRDRYWGTPLPVWVCDAVATHRTVVGSYEELADRWGQPLPEDFDPHKPFIDEYTFACDQDGCGGTMRRVAAVIDAWFDSGAMPYAQWHYPFEGEAEFPRHFPADFICEGLDQTRGWFYSLLAIAAGVSESAAYKNVVVNGLVLDADGRKMSKRVGNVVDPWKAVAEFGADAVRLYLLASSQVWLPKRFDPQAIREVAAGFLNRLRNTYGFFALYAEDWSPEAAPPVAERALIDRWLLRRVETLVRDVRTAWDGYDVTAGVRAIIEFCDNDLSNWYVRVNRRRFWAPDAVADPAAVATLYEALVTVSQLLAPAAPFLSEAIHRRLVGTSVHLVPFPPADDAESSQLEVAMGAIRRLATLARAAREEAGLRVRQPLARMRVAVPATSGGDAFEQLLGILAREVNVREVDAVSSDEELVRLRAKPNFRTLGKRYGKGTPQAAKAATALSRAQLQALESGESVALTVDGDRFEYHPEDVVVEREVASDWLVQTDGPYVAALDPDLDEELRLEGLAREVVNRVQRLRKEAGYDYNSRIALSVSGADVVLQAVRRFRQMVGGETLAPEMELGSESPEADRRESVTIDGHTVTIGVRRSARQTT
jgi:isoleucyl-tRNA synthetase